MEKENLSILLIDRKVESSENVVKDIFEKYGPNYGLLMFPPKEEDEKNRIQIIFFNYNLIKEIENLFPSIKIDYDPNDMQDFFDFDVTQIEEDVFYDVLGQQYSISLNNLSEVEKKIA